MSNLFPGQYWVITLIAAVLAYVFIYQPPLVIPDQATFKTDPKIQEGVVLLAKRWNTSPDNIAILALWKRNLHPDAGEARITVLNTQTMAVAMMYSPDPYFSYKPAAITVLDGLYLTAIVSVK